MRSCTAARAESSRVMRRPVAAPPAWTMRRREWPPSSPRARLPRRSASKRTPSRSRSRTRAGESSHSTRTALSRAASRPAAIVSAAWRSGVSSSASAAAIPPWAQYDAVCASGERLTSTTRAPSLAAVSAAYGRAGRAPTTATSARRDLGSRGSMAARRYGTGARARALQPPLLAAARDGYRPPRAGRPHARDPGRARAPRRARLRPPRGAARDRGAAAGGAHAGARGRRAGDERPRGRVRPRHADLGGLVGGGAPRGGRRVRARRGTPARPGRARRLLPAAATRAPRRARPGDGLLPVRQPLDRGPPRNRLARRRARVRARLGRPPRQRDELDLPRVDRGALREHPPVPLLSGHGPADRRRVRSGRGLLDQPARAGGRGRGPLLPAGRARGAPPGPRVRSPPGAGVGRVRRASPRSRGRLRARDSFVRRADAPGADARQAGRLRARRARRLRGRDHGGAGRRRRAPLAPARAVRGRGGRDGRPLLGLAVSGGDDH